MFGFGKKKLDDRLFSGLLGEIGMFQRWYWDFKHTNLSSEAINMILKRIIERKNLSVSKDQLLMMQMLTMGNELNTWTELRTKAGFDKQVAGFCKSINLPEAYYA